MHPPFAVTAPDMCILAPTLIIPTNSPWPSFWFEFGNTLKQFHGWPHTYEMMDVNWASPFAKVQGESHRLKQVSTAQFEVKDMRECEHLNIHFDWSYIEFHR